MSTLKFTEADFFDAENGMWAKILPVDFSEDTHAGRIECPAEGCHGSLSFVSGHHSSGSISYSPDHFRTNGNGEPHSEGCLYSPEPTAKTTLRMQDALADGKFILLNINFSTSFNLEKGRLKDKFARAAMDKWEGRLRKEWIAENGRKNNGEKKYESFSGHSLEKLSQDILSFRKATENLGITGTEKLMVSYLHGVIPWTHFFVRDVAKNERATRQLFDIRRLYNILSDGIETAPHHVKRLWGAAPSLRMDLELYKKSRISSYGGLYTNVRRTQNTVEVEGNSYTVQDVIQPKDASLRGVIQSAKSVSLVATPYLVRQDIERALAAGEGTIQVNWPISNADQLILRR